jgi:hypothetical protein
MTSLIFLENLCCVFVYIKKKDCFSLERQNIIEDSIYNKFLEENQTYEYVNIFKVFRIESSNLKMFRVATSLLSIVPLLDWSKFCWQKIDGSNIPENVSFGYCI